MKRLSTIAAVVKLKGQGVDKLTQILQGLGIQYNAKLVDKTLAMAISNTLPIVKDDACMKAFWVLFVNYFPS